MAAHLPRRATLLLLVLLLGWPRLAAAAPAAPSPTNVCFVPSLYRDLFDRAPTATEADNGLSFLESGAREAYALSLLTGTEYRTLLIDGWYQQFLGRPVDGALASWLALFGAGSKDEDVMSGILGSLEYATDTGGTDEGFIKSIYVQLLGRTPQASDYTNWEFFLGSHTHAEMAHALLTSFEYQANLIQTWYQHYLGRNPTGPEIDSERSAINNPGGSNEFVQAAILGSVEYFARAGLCALYLPLVRR